MSDLHLGKMNEDEWREIRPQLEQQFGEVYEDSGATGVDNPQSLEELENLGLKELFPYNYANQFYASQHVEENILKDIKGEYMKIQPIEIEKVKKHLGVMNCSSLNVTLLQ